MPNIQQGVFLNDISFWVTCFLAILTSYVAFLIKRFRSDIDILFQKCRDIECKHEELHNAFAEHIGYHKGKGELK